MQNRFLQLEINPRGRDFVIGDIHGRYTDLMQGLQEVDFDFGKDRLFCVGDLIDRGLENMQCLDLIWYPWFYATVGNHEMMMAESWTNRTQYHMWVHNGGEWFYTASDKEHTRLKETFTPYILEKMPLAIEFIAENGKRVGITHAGMPAQWPWWELRKHLQNLHDDALKVGDHIVNTILWTRNKINNPEYNFDVYGTDLLVHGHTPSIMPVWRGNAVYIDQGYYQPNNLKPINVMDLLEEL